MNEVIFVPPWIPAAPKLVVVGQSPGREEGRQGRPFIGPAGRTLHQWLRAVGFCPTEDTMYTNVDPYYHPDDPNHRPTVKECKEGYARILTEELGWVADTARCVLLLGEPAAHMVFHGRMGQMHGREGVIGELPVLAAYHPAYYLRKVEHKARAEIESMMLSVLSRCREIVDHGMVPVELPTPQYPDTLHLAGFQAIDIETTGEKRIDTADPRRARFVCLSAWPEGAVVFTPPTIAPDARLLIHNHPYDAVVLGHWAAEWEDTKMLAWLAGMPDTTLKGLKSRLLQRPAYHYDQAEEAGLIPEYCLGDSKDTWDLFPILWDRLTPGSQDLYLSVEKPLLPLWAKMTIEGSHRVDREGLRLFQAELLNRQERGREVAYEYLPKGRTVTTCARCGLWQEEKEKGQGCDPEAPEWVTEREYLSKAGEIKTRRTAIKGSRHAWVDVYQADALVNLQSHDQLLSALRSLNFRIDNVQRGTIRGIKHPVADALLELSEVNKLLGTYVEPWLAMPEGQRFGCIWRPTGTATGRVSSAYPNLQNVPRSMEKYLLSPEEGYTVLEFDNAQLEVRIAAHISARDGYPDDALIEACFSEDFHGTMMQAFGVTDRRLAKVGVFGTMYLGGAGAFLAACQTYGVEDVTYDWAQSYTRQVMSRMREYFRWAYGQEGKDEVEGLFGRHHIIPPGDEMERHRYAVNYPIQGGAGTVTKIQMLALHRAGYWVIRQIHDSVSVAVRDQDVEVARVEIPQIMERCVPELLVPIKVEVK